MKVFIVLRYVGEKCIVESVHTKKADAYVRANREKNTYGAIENLDTIHVIGKRLRGHVARVGTRKKLIGYLIRR